MAFIHDMIDRVFYGQHGQVMRYLFFGVLNVVVTWSVYAACVLMGVNPVLSNVISWIVGVTFAFVVNKLYVFNSLSRNKGVVSKEATTFTLGRIVTGVIALVGFPVLYNLGLNDKFLGVDGFLSKIIVSGIEIVLNYLISKYCVFRHPEEQSE